VSDQEALLPQLVESCLQAGADARFEVSGRSMWPLIRPGDVVTVRQPATGELALGDVVAVKGMPGGGLLVHRIVRLREGRLLLRGDNTTLANGEYPTGQVLAVVDAVERHGRLVWFGAGRSRRLVALLVRTGCLCRVNRGVLFVRRVGRRSR
jgi:phage repressor protein C with HTH and peptisase S24 domain